MPRNNRYGAAGRRGIPALTVAAFFKHFTYTRTGSTGHRASFINGQLVRPALKRQLRRWNTGTTGAVGRRHLESVLIEYGFDLPAFDEWCSLHSDVVS